MSLTRRIRSYLVAVALLPPLMIMTVIYFYSEHQQEITRRENAASELRRAVHYREQVRRELYGTISAALTSAWFERSRRSVKSGRVEQIDIDARLFDLDFLELLDSNGRVLASSHRPGLVGEIIATETGSNDGSIMLIETVEYDRSGPHAALVGTSSDENEISLYGGWYLAERMQLILDQIVRGRTEIIFAGDPKDQTAPFDRMEFGSLYQLEEHLGTVLAGGKDAGFYLVATFESGDRSPALASFLNLIGLVALASVLVAIGIGFYISGKARREIDNLVDAFTRVADGDLDTTVMAYEEGEFSDLADAFSEMVQKLRLARRSLATTEKIAAWQTMARKIAHEIKNPLTPIAISADDLRRSYQEKLPQFDQTVERNTRMIKQEVTRLSRLLDQFVGFARMAPPRLADMPITGILDDITALFERETSSDRLQGSNTSARLTIKGDREQIKQLLLNLTKNSFEAADNVTVRIAISDEADVLKIIVEDDGPGFARDVFKQSFEPYLSSKPNGSGLGLVICQRIVHDHGGTIELQNRHEGGAAVVILLPQA